MSDIEGNQKPADKKAIQVLLKSVGLDLNTLIVCKKEGMIHDIVYLAEAFGIDLGYKFVWYGFRR